MSEADYWRERARFCLATGVVSPAEYDDMTYTEIGIWVEELRKINKTK